MRRTAALFLVLAIIFSVMTPCGALAAEEEPSGIEWQSYYYVDADGNETNDTVLVNDPYFEGAYIKSQNNAYKAYLQVRVDGEHVDLAISMDNETLYEWPGDYTFTVNVYASSSLTAPFTGTVKQGSTRIVLDSDARDFIAQDMRMLTSETGIEIIPDADLGAFQFILPHDGSFRDLYDAEEARNWNNASAANNAGGTSSDTVTPAFKETVDAYYQHFHDLAAAVQDANLQGGVGVLDIIKIAAQAWSDYQQFKEFGESATTQADRDYYESIRGEVLIYLTTGALGAFANNNG